jgi:hypothetical protein
MTSLGKFLTIATLTVGFAASVAPMASACGVSGVITQPAVVGTTLLQPSVIDTGCNTLTQPVVLDQGCNLGCNTLTQPAIIDNGMCNTCGLNTLVQPSIIDSSYALPPVMYGGFGFRRRWFDNWF